MKLYKLTDQNDQTHGGTQWGEGVTHRGTGVGELCGPGYIHAYTDPLLAVLLNPLHGNFDLTDAHLWEGAGVVAKNDHGLKVGCVEFTTARRVPLPVVSAVQKVAFGILCALEVYSEPGYVAWARGWLDGSDRSYAAADAYAAAADDVRGAAYAAYAAAAYVVASDASCADAVAANAASSAADAAGGPLDLAALAARAMERDYLSGPLALMRRSMPDTCAHGLPPAECPCRQAITADHYQRLTSAGGHAAAKAMTTEQRQARARKGQRAAARKRKERNRL
jgi:hypothetical protein